MGMKSMGKRTIGEIMDWLAPAGKSWNELRKWPPNVFALTSTLLSDSGAYCLAVCPPNCREWPAIPDFWTVKLPKCSEEWRSYAVKKRKVPEELRYFWNILCKSKDVGISDLKNSKNNSRQWKTCEAILCLHAMADEACAGFGIPSGWPGATNKEITFSTKAYRLLTRFGTFAELYPETIRVLPKMRTPQVGIALRSLSNNLAVIRSEVNVEWRYWPYLINSREPRINIMLYPSPDDVAPGQFKDVSGKLTGSNIDSNRFGLFEYASDSKLDVNSLIKAVNVAEKRVGNIDMIVFPEIALSENDLEKLMKKFKKRNEMPIILAGVRKSSSKQELGSNYVRLVARIYEKKYVRFNQHKHHRWCLDDQQIRQYHLGSVLDPNKRWWEAISLGERKLNFIGLSDAVTVCPLICEDLARQEPTAEVVRAVGPSLVIAILFDGPQTKYRWSARYATVLADDPGCSVLSLTSLGMAMQSRPAEQQISRCVALWKDKKTGFREIEIANDKKAIVLSVCREWEEQLTADGRSDNGTTGTLFLAGVEQIGVM